LINGAAIANFSGFAHHHTHGMVKKYPLTNHGRWMNFNAGEKPRHIRDKASQPKQTRSPASVGYAVKQQGMQTGVTGQNFQPATGGWVSVEDGLRVGANS
jgi:hypothetical protein